MEEKTITASNDDTKTQQVTWPYDSVDYDRIVCILLL